MVYAETGAIHVMYLIYALILLPVFYSGIVTAQVTTADVPGTADTTAAQIEDSATDQHCVCPPVASTDKEMPTAASNTAPEVSEPPTGAISPYTSCRRKGRAHSNCPCNCAGAQKTAEEQGYELLNGPYGGKQKAKKRKRN